MNIFTLCCCTFRGGIGVGFDLGTLNVTNDPYFKGWGVKVDAVGVVT